MKVLKILAIVFGALLLLTGAGLLVGSYAAGKGDDAVQRQIQASGLAGPADGVITAVDGQSVTVDYTDARGQDHTATGQAALTKPAEVGDTVPVYYSPDQPEIVVITDVAGDTLSKLAGGLKTGGIVSLILGGLLLLAGIIGMVLGKKTPALAGGPPPGQQWPAQQYPPQGQQYPPQGQQYPQQPGQQYPPQGQPYPPQQGSGERYSPQPRQDEQYPPPPGPGEQYPPQPNQGYGPPPSQPGQPPQQLQYPQQPPPSYPPQQNPPQQYPPQGPPSAQ